MMIFRFKGALLIMGEVNLASSLVAVNQLNSKLQRLSADGRKQKEINAIAAQIMLECEVIREVTNNALEDKTPGLFKRWFGNGKN